MGYILKVKNKEGEVFGIPAIQGEPGKTAYEIAVENGFTGSEAEWAASHFRAFFVGTGEPDPSLGNDGDIYLRYAEN